VIVAAGLALVALTSADRAFHAKVAELRADGFAVTTAGFLGPAPPDAEAAAAELRAAWGSLGAGPGTLRQHSLGPSWQHDVYQFDPHTWYESDDPNHLRALEAWLETARPFYERISAAVARPAIRFPQTVDEYGMPDVLSARRLVESITETLEARAHGAPDPLDRVSACRDLLRLGRRLGTSNPSIGSGLEWHALIAARDGITAGVIDARLAEKILGGDLAAPPVDLARFARLDVAATAESWSAVLRGWRPKTPDGVVLSSGAWERLRNEAKRLVLNDSNHGCGSDHEPYSAKLTRRLDLVGALAHAPDRWPRSTDPPLPNEGMQNEVEGLVRVGERLRQHTAALTLARVALAVRARRAATGHWPASLDDVADAFGGTVPEDPFGGARFSYEVSADSVRLSSVGRDASDAPLTDSDRLARGLAWEFAAPATGDK